MINAKEHVPHIAIIAAIDEENGIGRKGGLLCHLPSDLKYFKKLTSGHCVIMGRKTFKSLPKGALPNRTNVVVTSDKAENYPNCFVARSINEALQLCGAKERVFIIGGGEVYKATIKLADTLYITRIHHTFDDADTFFPMIDSARWNLIDEVLHEKDERHNFNFSFLTYVKTK